MLKKILTLLVLLLVIFTGCSTMNDKINTIKEETKTETKVSDPYFNRDSGTYPEDFSVTLHSSTLGAQVYYTINGDTPTASSTLYTTPIDIIGHGNSFIIKAIALKDGLEDSNVVEKTYTRDDTAAAPENYGFFIIKYQSKEQFPSEVMTEQAVIRSNSSMNDSTQNQANADLIETAKLKLMNHLQYKAVDGTINISVIVNQRKVVKTEQDVRNAQEQFADAIKNADPVGKIIINGSIKAIDSITGGLFSKLFNGFLSLFGSDKPKFIYVAHTVAVKATYIVRKEGVMASPVGYKNDLRLRITDYTIEDPASEYFGKTFEAKEENLEWVSVNYNIVPETGFFFYTKENLSNEYKTPVYSWNVNKTQYKTVPNPNYPGDICLFDPNIPGCNLPKYIQQAYTGGHRQYRNGSYNLRFPYLFPYNLKLTMTTHTVENFNYPVNNPDELPYTGPSMPISDLTAYKNHLRMKTKNEFDLYFLNGACAAQGCTAVNNPTNLESANLGFYIWDVKNQVGNNLPHQAKQNTIRLIDTSSRITSNVDSTTYETKGTIGFQYGYKLYEKTLETTTFQDAGDGKKAVSSKENMLASVEAQYDKNHTNAIQNIYWYEYDQNTQSFSITKYYWDHDASTTDNGVLYSK